MDRVETTGLPHARGEQARPGWGLRFLAFGCYLGLAPFLRRFCRGDPFVQHHAAQALAVVVLLFACFTLSFFYWLGISFLLVFQRALYDSLPVIDGWSLQVRDGIPIALVLLTWLLAWLAGAGQALFGSSQGLPLVTRLARRPGLVRVGIAGNIFLLAGMAVTTAVALHASSLTREDDEPARVYLLYDDMGFIPRWVFNLGAYRISREATARWGPGSVVVAPLDEHHLRLALLHGRFVFLACHGMDGEIETPDLRVSPTPFCETEPGCPRGVYVMNKGDPCMGQETPIEVGDNLRFLYNSACDSGSRAAAWERALSPAEVKTFDRLSAVAEHICWLWLSGPARLRDVPE